MIEVVKKVEGHISALTSACLTLAYRVIPAAESDYYVVVSQIGDPMGAFHVDEKGNAKGWLIELKD
jgi:hypothetical protein